MKVCDIDLCPFRSFASQHVDLQADRVLITGKNGRGKSNILEALSFLSIGKSVRGARDQQAVPHGAAYFDIGATCSRKGDSLRLRLFYSRSDGKHAFADGEPLPRVSDLLGLLRTVHFAPEDVSLVLRFPAQRRRLLDILISQARPEYLRALQRYHRVLAQRNALLRGPGLPAAAVLEPWTQQLATLGGALRQHRLDALAALQAPFASCVGQFGTADEQLALRYQGPDAADTPQEQQLLEELHRRQRRELEIGYTLAGPHRDDLLFLLDGQPADAYASAGQLKTALIAWKVAEVHFLAQGAYGQPVLLLDDALSELDADRGQALMEMVDACGQVILTSCQPVPAATARGFVRVHLED